MYCKALDRALRWDESQITAVAAWSPPDDLVHALSSVEWKSWFERARAREADRDWTSVIKHSVGRNTFRAFHGTPQPPSQVFREWASYALFDGEGRFERLRDIHTSAEYTDWLWDLAESLRRRWAGRMGGPIPFGPSIKLPNLLMKAACRSPRLPEAVFTRIVWFLHVPLDRYSIEAISGCVPGSPFAARIGKIPKPASMGFVKGAAMYNAFQECIAAAAVAASVPPIALDILAWDAAHQTSLHRGTARRVKG
jgi:hypothetical protein